MNEMGLMADTKKPYDTGREFGKQEVLKVALKSAREYHEKCVNGWRQACDAQTARGTVTDRECDELAGQADGAGGVVYELQAKLNGA